MRTILTLGAGLRLEREFRDILVDIVRCPAALLRKASFNMWFRTVSRAQDEKVIEPARKINWTSKDLATFLDGMLYAFARLEVGDAAVRDRLLPAFERYVTVVRAISARMYQL